MNQPTENSIRLAASVISRAALFDDRIPDGDKGRILAWAQALEPFDFQQPDALAAVTAHYQAANVASIRPGDVIAHARQVRKDRAERDKGQEVAAPMTPPDAQLGGLPIGGADGSPAWSAYDVNGAGARECPTCHAPPDHACINVVSQATRKIPCIGRITGKRVAAS